MLLTEERGFVLADGTKLKGSYGYSSKVLWLHLEGMTIMEAFPIVSDPGKTARIDYISGEILIESFEGYTEICAINAEEDGVTVGLKRPGEEG